MAPGITWPYPGTPEKAASLHDGRRVAGNEAPFTAKPAARFNLGHGEAWSRAWASTATWSSSTASSRMTKPPRSRRHARTAAVAPAAAPGPAAENAATRPRPRLCSTPGSRTHWLRTQQPGKGTAALRQGDIRRLAVRPRRLVREARCSSIPRGQPAARPRHITSGCDRTGQRPTPRLALLPARVAPAPGDDCRWLWFQGGDMVGSGSICACPATRTSMRRRRPGAPGPGTTSP